MNYEVCIIHTEYRWVEVEASTHEEAKNYVRHLVNNGYIGDTKPEDTETELDAELIVEN